MKIIWSICLWGVIAAGCSSSNGLNQFPLAERQYHVSCPPHGYYCYRKTELICYRGYRIIQATPWVPNPEMVVECR